MPLRNLEGVPPIPTAELREGGLTLFRESLNQVHNMLRGVTQHMGALPIDFTDCERRGDGIIMMPVPSHSPLADLIQLAEQTTTWLEREGQLAGYQPETRQAVIRYLTTLCYPINIADNQLHTFAEAGPMGYARLVQYFTEILGGTMSEDIYGLHRRRNIHPAPTPLDQLRALSSILNEQGATADEQLTTVRNAIRRVIDNEPPQADTEVTDPIDLFAYEIIRDLIHLPAAAHVPERELNTYSISNATAPHTSNLDQRNA